MIKNLKSKKVVDQGSSRFPIQMNSDSISDEQWVNELVMSLSMLMNEDKLEEVVSLGKASLARVRVLHENDGVLAFVLHQLGAGLCGLVRFLGIFSLPVSFPSVLEREEESKERRRLVAARRGCVCVLAE